MNSLLVSPANGQPRMLRISSARNKPACGFAGGGRGWILADAQQAARLASIRVVQHYASTQILSDAIQAPIKDSI